MNKLLFCLPIAILIGIILLTHRLKKKKQEISEEETFPSGSDYQRIKLSLPISKCLECQGYQESRDSNCCSSCSQSVKCVNPGISDHYFQHHGHHCHSHRANNIKQDCSL
jgi:hypothetical protein